eukprot:8339241-Alexandrium_andersonii.AAC.1
MGDSRASTRLARSCALLRRRHWAVRSLRCRGCCRRAGLSSVCGHASAGACLGAQWTAAYSLPAGL